MSFSPTTQQQRAQRQRLIGSLLNFAVINLNPQLRFNVPGSIKMANSHSFEFLSAIAIQKTRTDGQTDCGGWLEMRIFPIVVEEWTGQYLTVMHAKLLMVSRVSSHKVIVAGLSVVDYRIWAGTLSYNVIAAVKSDHIVNGHQISIKPSFPTTTTITPDYRSPLAVVAHGHSLSLSLCPLHLLTYNLLTYFSTITAL